jgi:hypothetical protein
LVDRATTYDSGVKTIPLGVWTWKLAGRGEWCDECSQPLVGKVAVELHTRRVICASCALDHGFQPSTVPESFDAG